MACAVTKRNLVYFTFGDAELRDEVFNMYDFLKEKGVRVKDIWTTLKRFQSQRLAQKELYNFIYSCHSKEVKEVISWHIHICIIIFCCLLF